MSVFRNYNLNNIKILVFDLDGTLTDGFYSVSESGNISKNFFSRDFSALEVMQRHGYMVLIITGSLDSVIKIKYRQLPYSCKSNMHIARGIDDKVKYIEDFIKKYNLSWDNIAYMGDGLNDIEAIDKSYFTGCPGNSAPEVEGIVNYVSSYDGGRGAVYDFCMFILKNCEREKNEKKQEEN